MKISTFNTSQTRDVISLFTTVFAESEGKEEGELIGRLVRDLISTSDECDIEGFVAVVEDEIAGCIFFSRLTLSNEKVAFILSPVAVATEQQGKGIGQQLISYGLDYLRSRNVDLVFTYGDPAFYSKVGFQQISEDVVKAPLNLTYPEGWLAQSLQSDMIDVIKSTSECVAALNKQHYW